MKTEENGAAVPVTEGAAMPATRTARLASAGLAAVLIFLAMFSIWGAHTSSSSANRVKRTIEIRRAFDSVREAVASEESLERKYRLEPGPASRAAFDAAAASFVKSIERVDEIGSARDRRDAAALRWENGYYLMSTVALFAAVDRHDARAALKIDHTTTDPTFARVHTRAQALSDRHRTVAVIELRRLSSREHKLVFATVGVFALGLALLALFEALRRVRARKFLETVSALRSAKLAEALRVTKEQLRESQKLEAVGRLAGGVAHDFNNLLTVIGGYAELALSGDEIPSSTRGELAEIREAARQAQSVTAQLLAFSGRQAMEPYVLELNATVERNVSMLRRLIGADIEMTTVFDEHVGYVEVDPTQIGQVLMNLTLNAKDAMPNGGELTIHTGSVHLGDAEAQKLGLEPTTYATVSVVDTGSGIPAEAHGRIFEPFFTTKERGEGTGLGLATAYGIVNQSGGQLSFTTKVGEGTAFTIHLPQLAQPAQAQHSSEAAAHANVTVQAGHETILVIEDEAAVRRLVARMLRARGYTVLHASRGEEAIALVQGHPGRIDLVLSDVVMPGMAGPAAVARIRAMRPEIRRLYMSGYTEEAATTRGALDAEAPLLGKPFSGDELIQGVADALDTSDDRRAAA